MLEGLAAWVLNTYLGQYLEDLNTDQLSIGLLKGEVELENVPLRKDALRHLDMAMEVKAGFVGKVRLQIPVARLRSEPWLVAFEQLYLVAGPIDLNEFDEAQEEAANFARKISLLDSIEASWRAELERRNGDSSYRGSSTSWLSFGTSFISNIVENIQLKIQDVHIRYEDTESKPGEVFACGFTVDSLTVQSSDQHWVPKSIVTIDQNISYKVLELKKLGIYSDSSSQLYGNKPIGELVRMMYDAINGVSHDYILQPVSATACLKRNLNSSPLKSRSKPRFTCDLKLETFPMHLNDVQYNQIITSLRYYGCIETARPYRKWRPKCIGIKGNVSKWWQYAIQCHLEKIHNKYLGRNWEFVLMRVKDILKYVNIYCNYLKNPNDISSDLKNSKCVIEHILNFEELRFIREVCMERISKQMEHEKPMVHSAAPSVCATVPTSPTPSTEGTGILQSWFPAWAGWYSATLADIESEDNSVRYDDEICSITSDNPSSLTLEEEILYVLSDSIENNTFMKRDAVFAQLSFSLKKGCFILSQVSPLSSQDHSSSVNKPLCKRSLFELEFSNVKIDLESRPRNQSFSVSIELGSMSLRDQVTPNSPFPLIISQQRDNYASAQKLGLARTTSLTASSGGVYSKLSSMISSVSKVNQTPTSSLNTQGPLFSLFYEKKPRNVKSDHKLVITSQALDIIYNQIALNALSDFFFPYALRKDEDLIMQSWTTTARRRYEALKQQTKDELKKNLDTFFLGVMNIERKKWDIQLDISAPQIIIPEHFHDNSATVVVFDFGKLIFRTASSSLTEPSSSQEKDTISEDDDDAFATPCSTPEEFTMKEETEVKSTIYDGCFTSDSNLHKHLYDRFDLQLCDLQVIVAKVRDNWRFAYQKGTGPLHVLDRFTINLHLEQRILNVLPDYSVGLEHQWPNLILSGTLPQLVVHINEQKVQALHSLTSSFTSPLLNAQQHSPIRTCKESEVPFPGGISHSATVTSFNQQEAEERSEFPQQEFPDQSYLLVMQFTVDRLSLELQSRGRSIAELQVTGMKHQLNKRPHDLSVLLSVHSLLLIDALQTFGPDFELLVASHKHISMDSVSGSLLDSEPCSPVSPGSPDLNNAKRPTSPVALSQALSSLASHRAHSPTRELSAPSPTGVASPTFSTGITNRDFRDSEALIIIEVNYISSQSPLQDDSESRLFSSVQFNALDVIANQETVVELVGFLHQIFSSMTNIPARGPHPNKASSSYDLDEKYSKPTSLAKSELISQSFYGSIATLYPPESDRLKVPLRAEVSFDFHKLTILLLRGAMKDKEVVGRKFGTAVLSDAKIGASIVKDILQVEGSLGGFQIRDVTLEGSKHQCIVSVGHDPIVERSQDLALKFNNGTYHGYDGRYKEFGQKAFSFKVLRPLVLSSPYDEDWVDSPSLEGCGYKRSNNKLKIEMRLASVCYTHSPQFLSELKSCATDFKQYMAQVALSIKQAAAEVALGLVSRRIESFVSLSSTGHESSPKHTRHLMHSRSIDTLMLPNPPPTSTWDSATLTPIHSVAPDLTFCTELDIILETPIVVLPESPNSSTVLVAHLGQISVTNKGSDTNDQVVDDDITFFLTRTACFQVSVKDMSLYSLNVEERLRSRDITFQPLSATMMCAEELYNCKSHGSPILHDTTLELILIQKRNPGLLPDCQSGLIFPSDIYIDLPQPTSQDSFTLDGGFVTPLKLSLSRHHYQQILHTLCNLSLPNLSKNAAQSESGSLSPIYENETLSQPKDQSAENAFSHFALENEIKGGCPKKCTFTIPILCVELRGDVGDQKEPLVNLVLEEIVAVYEATEPFESDTQISLRSLVMEDLQLLGSDPNHRILMKSENVADPVSSGTNPVNIPESSSASNANYISSSCPEIWPCQVIGKLSSSLPSKLEMERPFYKALKKSRCKIPKIRRPVHFKTPATGFLNPNELVTHTCLKHKSECPCTPPPSPTPDTVDCHTSAPLRDGTLVYISIREISEKHPEFLSTYDGTHRFINIDFNHLVTVINLESWVMVLDFFRSASEEMEDDKKSEVDSKSLEEDSDPFSTSDPKPTQEVNTIMEIQVRCLALALNNGDGELAKASINQVFIRSVGSEGNLTLSGKLGSLSVHDSSSYGKLYREKFLTTGTEAMTFQLFRYSKDDPHLNRDCDIRLKLRMSSIIYIHSQRFTVEMMQFFQQFVLLREIMSDWRATRAGLMVTGKAHGTRISMDITAGSPVIFIPMSNYSETLLGADLGSLSVSNKFLWSGSKDTISQVRREDLFDRLQSTGSQGKRSRSSSVRSRSRSGLSDVTCETKLSRNALKCLLDVMQVSLVNMDLFSSSRITGDSWNQKKTKHTSTESEATFWDFGSYRIERKGLSFLRDKCALKLQVERNLDGEMSRIVPDFSIHAILTKIHTTIDTGSYKMIRGILAYNLGEPVEELKLTPTFLTFCQAVKKEHKIHFPSSHVWTFLSINFDLDNVIVEAELKDDKENLPFACIHLIKSKLVYESYSDSSKDVDLVSQEILISDTRFKNCPVNKRANIFSKILQPAQDQSLKNENPLQAEVHYRSTKDVTRFTILLNNMRLMSILDWWLEAEAYIQLAPPNPSFSEIQDDPGKEKLETQIHLCNISPTPGFATQISTLNKQLPRLNPMVESTGLMTKHDLIDDSYQVPFELKLNITGSEVIVVENSSVWDTPAVILKTTAVVTYRPEFYERPISCNLNQCELYSCTLDLEEDTALSIIDPVTINIEVNDRSNKGHALDMAHFTDQHQHSIEISLHQLNVRLSYHDMKLFLRILESLPKQHEIASSKKASYLTQSQTEEPLKDTEPANVTVQVEKLSVLGFSKEDCTKSIKECGGRLDEAALWLTQNAQPQLSRTLAEKNEEFRNWGINLQGFELKTGSVNLTIIDDCGDCDVPLIEICFSRLGLNQNSEWKGSASCTLSVDYYHRALSGWEPFIEPWICSLDWHKTHGENGDKMLVSLVSENTVNISVTSTLIDLYYLVRDNWTVDYYLREKYEAEATPPDSNRQKTENVVSPPGYRRRTPFIPFALQNDTGCDLSFCPLTASDRSESLEFNMKDIQESQWRHISPKEVTSFSFEDRGKQRHGKSHGMKSHRLLVRVGNWYPVGPVTVDKVGVFFRLARYQSQTTSSPVMPNVRIVFAISMDGLARKLITVRSALLLTNRLPHPVEIKLENIAFRLGDVRTMQVASKSCISVPLLYAWSRLFVKPMNLSALGESDPLEGASGWIYSREPIHWKTLLLPQEEVAELRHCDPVNARKSSYRFMVYVRRDNYPLDSLSLPFKLSTQELLRSDSRDYPRHQEWVQPGHSIILMSPLTLLNLLPFDLHFDIKTTAEKGLIKPGEESFISSVDPELEVELCVWLDSLSYSSTVLIRLSNTPFSIPFRLNDASGRPVHLQLNITRQCGKALKVTVSAYFWLINRTGLPIVFKQDGASMEAAGQDVEHEFARCATPLLFSFSDQEASPTVIARIGRNLHRDAHPHFCKKFALTQGTWVRRLVVTPKDHRRPDIVYVVGVDVRIGRGRYRDTYMVTLSPRFHIENRSSHELLIAQRCFTSSFADPGAQSTWLRAIPGCWLPFHWPRLDKDPLLCVCMCDIIGSYWSGGFLVDKTDSFNINIRDGAGRSFFLRVEILMNDATYFIVFTDADSLPPPFRIDNFSEVPITYYQTGTQEERLRSVVKPRSCVPYAWDEVTMKPHITCIAPGGTSATYNLNVLGEGARITYENFIYIAFTGTFKSSNTRLQFGYYNNEEENEHFASDAVSHSSIDCLQLVLDVAEGSKVTLNRKELGRRSQLWRMTSTGMLQHEGSSPPYDPTSKKPRNDKNILVLDIAGSALLPSEYTPLMLRKPDNRRRMTQTWRFTEDGRLCCQYPNMFVQSKDGFLGLSSGSDVVIGPPQKVYYSTFPNGVPIEQAVCRQRLRPGSGLLAVKVSSDGPTRVLQITDTQMKNYLQVARTDKGDLVCLSEAGTSVTSVLSDHPPKEISGTKQPNIVNYNIDEIQVILKGGIGISIVDSSEELIYTLLSDVILEFLSSAKHRTLECSVRDIQVDNQMVKAQSPVVLYVTPQSKRDEGRHLPAIQVLLHQLRSPNLNAYIFKHLMITVKNLTLTIEEALLCKCLLLMGLERSEKELENVEESQYETRRLLAAATSANATRYYFTHLKFVLDQVRLSVLTNKNLTPELKHLRRKIGLTLVQFENALVSLDPFIRTHPFETWKVLMDSIKGHYEDELRSQAMRILGSTDFLGNPFGLLADVSEGVQELVRGGSVGGLVLNVTHGMANSTAKVTGSLSEVVGRVMLDRKHEETRQKLLTRQAGQTNDHFVAGLMGFGLGLYGGLTSIVAQTYTGAQKEGLPGFFSGFAKGMVGTVTKPAIGILDLAAGTASAVRDNSKNPSHKLPLKSRKPRVVVGMNGMMPRYSEKLAAGQELLRFFHPASTEIFLGYEMLRLGDDDLRLLISSDQIVVFSWVNSTETPSVVLTIEFRDLFQCRPLTIGSEDLRYYIELWMKAETSEALGDVLSPLHSMVPSRLPTKRPKVRCDTADIAKMVSQQINFAKNLHDELHHTLPLNDEDEASQELQ